MVWLVRGISRGWTDIPQENRRYPTNLELSLEKPSTRLNNAWDAETPRGSLPQRVPRHFVRCPARYDFWGRERFSTLKHNIAFNLFQGVRVPKKTARTLPTSLSWKAAVSAPKSRVCVLLRCSSSWFTTSGWARFPAVWTSSCSFPPSCFPSPSCGRSRRVSPSISSTTGPTCSPACYPQLRS